MKYCKMFKKRKNVNNFARLSLKAFNCTSNNIVSQKFIKFIRKNYRKALISKKILFVVNLTYNYQVSYKGKNPRMGKGSGFFIRNAIKLNYNKNYYFFKNISLLRIQKIKNKFSSLNKGHLL